MFDGSSGKGTCHQDDNDLFFGLHTHATVPLKNINLHNEKKCFLIPFSKNHSDGHPSDPKLLDIDIECAVVSKQMSPSDLRVSETEHKLELVSNEQS